MILQYIIETIKYLYLNIHHKHPCIAINENVKKQQSDKPQNANFLPRLGKEHYHRNVAAKVPHHSLCVAQYCLRDALAVPHITVCVVTVVSSSHTFPLEYTEAPFSTGALNSTGVLHSTGALQHWNTEQHWSTAQH